MRAGVSFSLHRIAGNSSNRAWTSAGMVASTTVLTFQRGLVAEAMSGGGSPRLSVAASSLCVRRKSKLMMGLAMSASKNLKVKVSLPNVTVGFWNPRDFIAEPLVPTSCGHQALCFCGAKATTLPQCPLKIAYLWFYLYDTV